ncbi:hypothetical protein J2X41_003266 [Caulobacter sp. BE254]|nr:hypothetical protein [Caulobacter sp. BE254]
MTQRLIRVGSARQLTEGTSGDTPEVLLPRPFEGI